MANRKHLAILKKGVKAWNEWRLEHPSVMPDLYDAELGGAELCEANLRGADLRGAHLRGTHLDGADLHGADLSGAWLAQTVFANVDLSEVKGLGEVVHYGPSTVGIDTIYKSKGRIPEKFLRGCGVPDQMIAIAVSVGTKANEFHSCFISYSSKDEEFAKRVHADLQDKGVRVWFAPEDLKIGDKFPAKIKEAIRGYDKLMLVLSKNSIDSAWVRREVRTALDREKKEKRTVLFPIRLDDSFLNTTEDWADDIRRNRHVGNFRQWKEPDRYQAAFARLLKDLQASESTRASRCCSSL